MSLRWISSSMFVDRCSLRFQSVLTLRRNLKTFRKTINRLLPMYGRYFPLHLRNIASSCSRVRTISTYLRDSFGLTRPT